MAACAMATGSWTTGKVSFGNISTVGQIGGIRSFLDATRMHPDIPNGAFYPTPKVNDMGVVENALMAELLAIAVASINTIAAIDIAKKQYRIAKDYWRLARNKWDRFRNIHMPCERKEMAEACGTLEYIPQYDAMAQIDMEMVDRQFDTANRDISTITGVHCFGTDLSLAQDIALMQSQVRGDSGNFAYRREEARADAKNDVRWDRRSQALNRGRDLQSNAASFAKAAADAYGEVGNNIGRAAEGASMALGYFANRKQTAYPQRIGGEFNLGSGFGANTGVPSPMNSGMETTNLLASDNTASQAVGNIFYTTDRAITAAAGKQNPGG